MSSNPAFCAPALENDSSHPKCGFLAAPALAHLEGFAKKPDIVEPSLDGHLYAWRANGKPVPGYPVALVDPAEVAAGHAMVAESINEPAIGDLNGAGHDDVVVASNEVYGAPRSSGDVSFAGVTAAAAGTSGRLYAIDGATGKIMPGWPVAMPGIIQNVLPLIGPGQDAAIAKIGGETVIVASVTGGALEELSPTGQVVRTMQQTGSQAFGAASDATDRSGAINLFESASVGDLLGTGTPDVVKYELSLSQAANLLLVGQNFPYNHLIGAFDGSTGATLPAFPTVTDDYQLLSANDIAKVDPTLPTNQIVGRHRPRAAARLRRRDRPRRPRLPQADRRLARTRRPRSRADGRMADMTREGYLFEWQTASARLPDAVAELPPRPAGQRQLQPRRHAAQGAGQRDPHRARRRQIPPHVHRAGRRRPVRHAGLLPDARQRQGRQPRPGLARGGRDALQRRSHASDRRAQTLDPGGRRCRQHRTRGERRDPLDQRVVPPR